MYVGVAETRYSEPYILRGWKSDQTDGLNFNAEPKDAQTQVRLSLVWNLLSVT